MSSVRDYAILWVGARPGTAVGGLTALGGNALLTTPQHALDGPEHTAASDQTRLDASVDAHGLLPKLSGDAADFLDGTGVWSPSAGSALAVKDEGSSLDTAVTSLDFTGAGVTATNLGHAITVAVPGGTDLGWFNVLDDGATGDGVTDDTAAIQATIAAATASGTQSGTVYFPPGTYLIGGALQDTGAFNGQLLLPNVSTSDPQVTIRMLGAARPPLAVHGGIPAPGGYSILKSSLTGASGTAACISGGNGSWPTQNNVQVIFEDLICLSPGNPTFTFLNASTCQGGRFAGIYVSTTDDWTGTRTQPTHSNAYGIKYPQWGQSNYTHVDGVQVGGFYTGHLQGELMVARGLTAAFCINAVELPFTEHPSLIVDMEQTACQVGINVTGDHACDILQYDAEHFTSPSWAVTTYDLSDGSNHMKGNIRWWGVAVGGTPDNSFLVNGATNVSYSELGSTPAASPGALVLLEQHTASSSATLDFTTAITSTYDEYQIEFVNIVPATNNTSLLMRASTNGGSTYDLTGIYDYTSGYAYSGGVGVGASATGQGNYLLMDAISNSANYGVVGSIRLFSPLSTALYKQLLGQTMRYDQGGSLGLVSLNVMGVYRNTTAVNAFRFLMSSGNITSGTIRVYGVAKS